MGNVLPDANIMEDVVETMRTLSRAALAFASSDACGCPCLIAVVVAIVAVDVVLVVVVVAVVSDAHCIAMVPVKCEVLLR